jgi:hypothetical protein
MMIRALINDARRKRGSGGVAPHGHATVSNIHTWSNGKIPPCYGGGSRFES